MSTNFHDDVFNTSIPLCLPYLLKYLYTGQHIFHIYIIFITYIKFGVRILFHSNSLVISTIIGGSTVYLLNEICLINSIFLRYFK